MGLIRAAADALGHRSWPVRATRPLRERVLAALYGTRGMPRSVNGTAVRILPAHRAWFPREYDPEVVEYLRSRTAEGMTAVSVGANVGLYPLQMAAWVGPTGRVIAFEPNPDTADILARHIHLNDLGSRVSVVRSAVGGTAGTAKFYAAGTDGMSRLGEPNPRLAGGAREIEVPVVTLDDYFAGTGEKPDILMMDIEGFEGEALRGARRILSAAPTPVFVVEMHPQLWHTPGTTPEAFAELLADLGMKAVGLSAQRDPMREYGHVALVTA